MPPNLQKLSSLPSIGAQDAFVDPDKKIRCAVLGCGMMGQEHISYILGYPSQVEILFLCDPHQPSLDKSLGVITNFQEEQSSGASGPGPTLLLNEDDLEKNASDIDLLVVATPNFMHTDTLLRWGSHDLTILVEKPVAVNEEQLERLEKASAQPDFIARVWVGMEYRFIPNIARMLDLLPEIGDVKMVTIRENRYPFLHKVGGWNRDREKTGDTLVEKCCHFFDLFRLITGEEVALPRVRALVQRGINYEEEPDDYNCPIIDSAYVLLPFESKEDHNKNERHARKTTIGCLELCMYAEGSRHQEEIIITGTKGRLEATSPENKVFLFQRPSTEQWEDRSEPPPSSAITQRVFDCSDVKEIFSIQEKLPSHTGYHYGSTAVEWYKLLKAMAVFDATNKWKPDVSLGDGLRAVEIGMRATHVIADTNPSTAC